jgi:hypothetical protein
VPPGGESDGVAGRVWSRGGEASCPDTTAESGERKYRRRNNSGSVLVLEFIALPDFEDRFLVQLRPSFKYSYLEHCFARR